MPRSHNHLANLASDMALGSAPWILAPRSAPPFSAPSPFYHRAKGAVNPFDRAARPPFTPPQPAAAAAVPPRQGRAPSSPKQGAGPGAVVVAPPLEPGTGAELGTGPSSPAPPSAPHTPPPPPPSSAVVLPASALARRPLPRPSPETRRRGRDRLRGRAGSGQPLRSAACCHAPAGADAGVGEVRPAGG